MLMTVLKIVVAIILTFGAICLIAIADQIPHRLATEVRKMAKAVQNMERHFLYKIAHPRKI